MTRKRRKNGGAASPIWAGAAEIELMLTLSYRGKQMTTSIPIESPTFVKLKLESEFKGLSLGEMVGELIVTALKDEAP